jgi:hypothetical protein
MCLQLPVTPYTYILLLRVEVAYRSSTATLQDVEDDGKGTRCLGEQLSRPVTGPHDIRGLILQVVDCRHGWQPSSAEKRCEHEMTENWAVQLL